MRNDDLKNSLLMNGARLNHTQRMELTSNNVCATFIYATSRLN